MQIATLDEVDACGWARGAHAALGFFDGVHLGHQELIRRARQEAARDGGHALVLTFRNHPLTVLRPESAPLLLTSFPERLELLDKAGLGHALWRWFDRAFSEISADDFVRHILVERLAVRSVIVGPNYRFGHHARGTTAALREMGRRLGFAVHVVEPVRCNGELVSSSRIRERIQAGEVAAVVPLLTRAFCLLGTVVAGERRGRALGFPTANLAIDSRVSDRMAGSALDAPDPERGLPGAPLLPADGVYATRLEAGGALLPSVTNIGVRPTFGETRRVVETHVLDFAGDLYGQRVRLHLTHRLRGERRFAGVEALRAQIADDVAQARELLRPAGTRA